MGVSSSMTDQITAGVFKVRIKSIIFKCPVNQKNNIKKCVIKLIILLFQGTSKFNYNIKIRL